MQVLLGSVYHVYMPYTTVHVVYLLNIQFSKFEYITNWLAFTVQLRCNFTLAHKQFIHTRIELLVGCALVITHEELTQDY